MTASRPQTPGPPPPEQSPASAVLLDTIALHVLSPSPEINGGRITFPSIPLDTKISHLKSRIQNSLVVPVPPERQRLIYRGRPLLNLDTTLRQVLLSELNASTEQNPSCTLHLVVSPAPGPAPAIPTNSSQHYASQPRPTPPGAPDQPSPAAAHQQHQQHPQHQPSVQSAANPLAHAQAAHAMFQNQFHQLQMQAMAGMAAQRQGHGQAQGQDQDQGQQQMNGHEQGHVPNQQTQTPSSPPPPNMQAFQAAIMQQQQMRAHAGMHGIHNPTMNGMPPGMPFGHPPQGPLGPITTRVHETVGPDGQRTRVVVNETTFQISRQATPVPGADRGGGSHGPGPQSQPSNHPGPQPPPIAPQQHQNEPAALPQPPRLSLHANERQDPSHHMHNYVPQLPAYQPTIPSSSWEPASTATTAWLLSSPNGPYALVFAPGHGLFTTTQPSSSAPFTRLHRPRSGLRFQQTPSGRIAPQGAANDPPLQAPNPTVANAQPQQALQAVARAREAAVAARQANAEANDFLRIVLGRVWTFIKLYFVIFMFTEPGSWFRWTCLLAAVLVSAMPSTLAFRELAARLQAQIDGLVPPPPQLVAPPARQQVEGQGADSGAAANTGPGRQGEPDPATTAARLVQEHRHRHPNALRDTLERVERALGLFVASLIPGVGERHVRVREEARREQERLETERLAQEEARRVEKAKEDIEKEKKMAEGEEVAQEMGESSKAGPQQGHTTEVEAGTRNEHEDRTSAAVEWEFPTEF